MDVRGKSLRIVSIPADILSFCLSNSSALLQQPTFSVYVEIKCQLDATDNIYCRFYCLLNMFRAILCPSSGARDYYTDGRCLWYLVLWFSGCRYGVELEVTCPVCSLQTKALNTTGSDHVYNTLELLMMGIVLSETC